MAATEADWEYVEPRLARGPVGARPVEPAEIETLTSGFVQARGVFRGVLAEAATRALARLFVAEGGDLRERTPVVEIVGASTAPVVPGTGFVPSLRGLQSRPDPAHPSGVAPGKRPRLTPNPAIAVRDDGSVMPFGCPGGDMQVQAMRQVFLNAFHFGMDLQEAVTAPRFSTWSFPNSFAPFDYLAAHVFLEDRFDASVHAELERRGHDVRRWPAFTRDAAAVEAIYRNARTGFLESAADPRQPAQAVVA